ncbi:MAG: hypothetical protein ACF787_14095 [Rhodopirellula sp. JB053]
MRSRIRFFRSGDSRHTGDPTTRDVSRVQPETGIRPLGATDDTQSSSAKASVSNDADGPGGVRDEMDFDAKIDLDANNLDYSGVWGSFDPNPVGKASSPRVQPPGAASKSNTDSGIWKRGTPVTGLLQRHSIRTKLFFGVVTLACTIGSLAVVGLLGFYRYRALADAISVRATELSHATELNQWATAAPNQARAYRAPLPGTRNTTPRVLSMYDKI